MKQLHNLVAVATASLLAAGWGMGAADTNAPAAPTNSPSPANIVLSGGGAAGTSNTVAVGWTPDRPVSTNGEYILHPQDQLYYQVLEDPEKDPMKGSAEVVVPNDAMDTMRFPVSRGSDLCVTIDARNKTVPQVRAELKAKLDADYYQDASVILQLKSQLPVPTKIGAAYFLGDGAGQNMLPLVPGQDITLFEAFMRVGWDKQFANLKKVSLTRISDPATHATTNCIINVDAVVNGGKRDPINNFVLRNEDTFKIPVGSFIFK